MNGSDILRSPLAPRRLPLISMVAVVLASICSQQAQAKEYPVRIAGVQIGLPGAGKGADSSGNIAKIAAWAPVYLDLELAAPIDDPCEIVVESADPDGISTTLTVPIKLGGAAGKVVAAADLGSIAYFRPAGGGEVTLSIRKANGGSELSEPFRVRAMRPRDPLAYVFLTLGNPISGFELPKPVTNTPDPTPGVRGGRIDQAEIVRVEDLPDRWFGYDVADVVLLNTSKSSTTFLTRLFGEQAAPADQLKREAMLEWVRRGGRLVVSVGENAELVSRLPALQAILPFAVNEQQSSRSVGLQVLSWTAGESSRTASTLTGALAIRGGKFPVANLVPKMDHPARILIPTRERLKDVKETVAAQAALGLGRVTVIAFDLDRPPFTEFDQRAEFWDWVLREGGASRASVGSEGKPKPGSLGPTEEEDELAVALRMHNDTFDGIPVVSFGWVAMLIVLYLLLIGPAEYFFLKRLFGRLELTWLTFPLIVASVSAAACYSAYALKGRELRINKVDVVDIDPASGRVYGTTWFTLFSPRIETYTLGVTPGEGWSNDSDPAGTMVSWVGPPRGGRATLLRRSYEYHPGEDGLEKVPVQVWSTKAFLANWSGRIGATSLVESRLEHPPGDSNTVIGTFMNHLPVPVLSDCVAFYAGNAYPIPGGTLHSGDTIRLVLDKGMLASQFLQREGRLEEVFRTVPSYVARPDSAKPSAAPSAGIAEGTFPLWGGLFHEAALTYGEGVFPRNASLRRLDQSWRLDPADRGEVILVGRVAPPIGPAEQTLSGTSSPSRLWLKGVPGSGAERTPLPGVGRQETWVRVYLPVK